MTILSLKSDASAASISEVPYVALVLRRLSSTARRVSVSRSSFHLSQFRGRSVSHAVEMRFEHGAR